MTRFNKFVDLKMYFQSSKIYIRDENGWKNPIPFSFSYFFSRKQNQNGRSENGNDISNIGISETEPFRTEYTDIGWKSKIISELAECGIAHI